ncbi:hypothetical protein MRB53_022188 [Persea americana]|uniref:Uncharacterized protein n=1 Tax=Persea americana TaxID=3435 RepID=A0ACC2L6L4_PERAE|nr:hypothetical protein MRB53_022188 [Persea americana]
MISIPTKISNQRDREPQIFFVSGEGDCETKQSGSFGTKNWAAINALRLSPSLGTVNPRKPDLLPLGTNSDTNRSSVSSNAEPCKQILFSDLFFLRFLSSSTIQTRLSDLLRSSRVLALKLIRGGNLRKRNQLPKAKKDLSSQLDPAIEERKRLKSLALSRNLLSNAPSKPISQVTSSHLILKHQGRDIVKKGQRKNRFLFSFPGLLAPVSAGKIDKLKDLGTKNPVLYIDFPQGRMKLFGTIVYPKNKYLTLQFARGGKNVTCEDCFENMALDFLVSLEEIKIWQHVAPVYE